MWSTLFLSLFPSYPTRSAASSGFVLPGVLSELGFVATVSFSHPDETNIVDEIIATNVERNVVFIGLTRIEQNEFPRYTALGQTQHK